MAYVKTFSRRRTAAGKRPGFTLIEVLLASAIMGLLFVALMEAFRTGLQMLEHSQRVTIASSLAEEIHQMTLTLPLSDPDGGAWGAEAGEIGPVYDDVDDLDGRAFTPPVNADGMLINGLEEYRQEVIVASVSEQDFDEVVADGTSGVSRVTVIISCRGDEICRMSWLVVGSM